MKAIVILSVGIGIVIGLTFLVMRNEGPSVKHVAPPSKPQSFPTDDEEGMRTYRILSQLRNDESGPEAGLRDKAMKQWEARYPQLAAKVKAEKAR